ncbi:MAG: flagellar biosynthesis protein FlhF [Lachnoclostridium sp.]|nr:flagellar biosynthesis protein FlhF [Lachnospira sp.]MCM1246840.1 flagellar biosynthesis protein FlhF [Lachnoclostridium sp.]MCM1534752.1 flagellar biosynthesis protein FlhF [Clostridium sp.]
MIIKKFVGKTEEEAVEAAKKELGEGVVIMNVKDVKPKGFFAFLLPKQVEVTVAREDEAVTKPSAPESVREEKPKQDAGVAGKTADYENSKGDAGYKDENVLSIESKLDSLQMFLQNQFNKEDWVESRAISEEAEEERDERQEEDSDQPVNPEQEKFFKLLYNTMLENEVDEKCANQIMDEADRNRKPNMPFDYILSNIYQKMVLKFGQSEGIVPAGKGPKTVFFIGPTGVGKTTTIAKIASSYAVTEKKKVALLTTDTYRIAAAEQLRTYANILETPFRVIYAEEELETAVSDFKDYDYIFVDTAGHSHQNGDQMEKLQKLLEIAKENTEYQTFLVLSATTKQKDLLAIADNYRKITDYQLIFTKLDETSSVGNLLNIKLHADTPIAYVTYGQNVPDDIEQFNPQKTVKQLLGGKG